MPSVVRRPNVGSRRNVTSCTVTTARAPARSGRCSPGCGRCRATAARPERQQHLLGELATSALAVLAGEADDAREVGEAIRAQGARAGGRRHDRHAQPRDLAGQRRRKPAQIGLGAARHARGEEERVQCHVLRAGHGADATVPAPWATSTGTSSPATTATSRGTSTATRAPGRGLRHRVARRPLPPLHGHRRLARRGRAPRSQRGRNVIEGNVGSGCPSPTRLRRGGAEGPARARPRPGALVEEVRRVLRPGGACSPPRPTRSAGSGTTTPTAARSPAKPATALQRPRFTSRTSASIGARPGSA